MSSLTILQHHLKKLWSFIAMMFLMAFDSSVAFASSDVTLGSMASSITASFSNLSKAITALSYIIGVAFVVFALVGFYQHHKNPAQSQLSKPLSQFGIGCCCVFFPTILSMAGKTLFGSSGGSVFGPTGGTFMGT